MPGRHYSRSPGLAMRGATAKINRNKKRNLILLIAGIVLVAAGAVIVIEATTNIVGYEQLTAEKLKEAEELVAEMRPPEASGQAAALPSGSGAVPSGSPAASPVKLPGPLVNQPVGTVLGIIEFPSLGNRRVPIIEGAEPKQLAEGAGHHQEMSYPGQSGNCLIFGHRNTVFRGFGKLKNGDPIKIETTYGTFTYKISDMQVAQPLDPLMFKGYREPVLTLVTCYPFDYVGAAPKRYIVVCKLDSSVAPEKSPNNSLEG